MGLKRFVCADMDPQAVPEMYLCPKLDERQLMAQAVRYAKVGEPLAEGQIASGAQITVAPGQCVLFVRGAQILEFCAVPGVYLYDREAPGSFLRGKLSCMAAAPVSEPQDGPEQVVYLNIEEVGGNAFSSSEKMTFRTDEGAPVSLACRGRYCYYIADPVQFYSYASAGIDRATLDAFLLEQFLSVLQPTYDRLAAMGVTNTTLSAHTPELIATLRALLYEKWYTACGIELQRVSVTSICMGGGSRSFGGETVQADRDELSEDDPLEKAAKEFFGTMLSALGSAFKNAGGDGASTPDAQPDQVSEETDD